MADGTLDDLAKEFVAANLSDVETALRNALLTGTPAIEKATDALLGSFRREPAMWQRIVEGGLGDLLGGLVMALIVALGQQPVENLLPTPTPSTVIQIDNSNTTVNVDASPDSEADVVDGEIVDDDKGSAQEEPVR